MGRGIWAAAGCCLIVAVWAFSLPSGHNTETQAESRRVAAILQENGSSFWTSAWGGYRTASARRGLLVSEYPYYDRDELEALTETVLLAQVDGVAANAPQDMSRHYLDMLKEARAAGVALVFLDSDPGPDCRDAFVGVDNEAGGRRLGDEVSARWNEGTRIVVLDNIDPSQAVAARRQGFLDAVTGPPAEAVEYLTYSVHEPDLLAGLLAELRAGHGPTLVVSFSPRFTVTAAAAVSRLELAERVSVYGFGENQEAVEYVEQGVIQVLMAQDSRRMGEAAAELLADLLEGKRPGNAQLLLELTALTPENAADSEVALAALNSGEGREAP